MPFIRNLLSVCFSVAPLACAFATDAPVGVPEDVLLPLTIRGYELHVVNGIKQPLATMVDGHKVDISVPVYAYLPSEMVTAERQTTLKAVKAVLLPLLEQSNVDAIRILPLVTKLQNLIAGETENAAVAPASPAANADDEAADGTSGPPKRIGDYYLNVLDRAKAAKITVGLNTREILLPIYFYLPDPGADGRFVSNVRQVASTLARLSKESQISGEDLGIAVLAIDRILSSAADFRRDHNPVAQLLPGQTGVDVAEIRAEEIQPKPAQAPNIVEGRIQ